MAFLLPGPGSRAEFSQRRSGGGRLTGFSRDCTRRVLCFVSYIKFCKRISRQAPGLWEISLKTSVFRSVQDVVLMRALRDMNLPKFVFEDVPLFLGLISDLFPGLDCPRVRYPDFNDAVEQVLEESGYVVLPVQVKWC